MEQKKYKLTKETMCFDGVTLHRIQALKDFAGVTAGEYGGWVESEENLSQDGDCWIAEEAKAYKSAQIYEDALLTQEAIAFGNVCVCGNAIISNEAKVSGYTHVEDAMIYGSAVISGDILIFGSIYIHGRVKINGTVDIRGDVHICDDVCICGHVTINGPAKISKDAVVCNNDDYIVFKNFWSSGRYFTWTRSNNKWSVGCFYGTGEELIKKAYQDSEKSGREYERVVRYVESILADEQKEQEK